MRKQTATATKPKATRSRKPAASKAASAAKAPTKAKAKAKTTGKMNGVAAAAKTSSRGARSAAGSKSQAGKRKPSQRGVGNSQQSGAAPQRQGEDSMAPQAPMFGGTRQVLIEEVVMTNRGGRKQGPEPYPFGDLTPSRMEGGAIHGPSFFIPESENPKRIIAAGRKRHKGVGKIFLTRQMEGPSISDPDKKVSGTRVWLAPAGYNE